MSPKTTPPPLSMGRARSNSSASVSSRSPSRGGVYSPASPPYPVPMRITLLQQTATGCANEIQTSLYTFPSPAPSPAASRPGSATPTGCYTPTSPQNQHIMFAAVIPPMPSLPPDEELPLTPPQKLALQQASKGSLPKYFSAEDDDSEEDEIVEIPEQRRRSFGRNIRHLDLQILLDQSAEATCSPTSPTFSDASGDSEPLTHPPTPPSPLISEPQIGSLAGAIEEAHAHEGDIEIELHHGVDDDGHSILYSPRPLRLVSPAALSSHSSMSPWREKHEIESAIISPILISPKAKFLEDELSMQETLSRLSEDLLARITDDTSDTASVRSLPIYYSPTPKLREILPLGMREVTSITPRPDSTYIASWAYDDNIISRRASVYSTTVPDSPTLSKEMHFPGHQRHHSGSSITTSNRTSSASTIGMRMLKRATIGSNHGSLRRNGSSRRASRMVSENSNFDKDEAIIMALDALEGSRQPSLPPLQMSDLPDSLHSTPQQEPSQDGFKGVDNTPEQEVPPEATEAFDISEEDTPTDIGGSSEFEEPNFDSSNEGTTDGSIIIPPSGYELDSQDASSDDTTPQPSARSSSIYDLPEPPHEEIDHLSWPLPATPISAAPPHIVNMDDETVPLPPLPASPFASPPPLNSIPESPPSSPTPPLAPQNLDLPTVNIIPATPLPLSPSAQNLKQLSSTHVPTVSLASPAASGGGLTRGGKTSRPPLLRASGAESSFSTPLPDLSPYALNPANLKPKRPSLANRGKSWRESKLHPFWIPKAVKAEIDERRAERDRRERIARSRGSSYNGHRGPSSSTAYYAAPGGGGLKRRDSASGRLKPASNYRSYQGAIKEDSPPTPTTSSPPERKGSTGRGSRPVRAHPARGTLARSPSRGGGGGGGADLARSPSKGKGRRASLIPKMPKVEVQFIGLGGLSERIVGRRDRNTLRRKSLLPQPQD